MDLKVPTMPEWFKTGATGVAALLIVLLLQTHAFAQGFDCRKASHADEKAICADADMRVSDRRLTNAYNSLRQQLSGEVRKAFEASQRTWLLERRECGADRSCLMNLYDVRLSELTAMTAHDFAPYLELNCRMDSCYYSRLVQVIPIKGVARGELRGAVARECSPSFPEGSYPSSYVCREGEVRQMQYVAHCSTEAPNISYKDDNNKWLRTRLSISDDGEYGFNRSAITMYLVICHNYVRRSESLDIIGAKFGYRSRWSSLDDDMQKAFDSVLDLAE